MHMVSMKLAVARQTERYRGETISMSNRPMFHLTPYCGWMNDPNGFSFYSGVYHLFYQYNPYDTCWNTMHWGHVTSSNLLDWNYQPCALAPDSEYDRGGCWSGSALTLDDGRHLLMYTGLREPKSEEEAAKLSAGEHGFLQVQNLAVGDGREYEKYSGNPVIDDSKLMPGMSCEDFRDPKIMKLKDGSYLALVANSASDGNGQILMFRSADLYSWDFWKPLIKNDGKFGRMWECPDFFELDGKWILIVSPTEMKAKGSEYHCGCGSIALSGVFDETSGTFIQENDQSIDYGPDFYAPQTMLAPDGRRIMIGWMQNWDTALVPPAHISWSGQMTLPRELSLMDGRLYQKPIGELADYYTNAVEYRNVPVSDEVTLYGVEGRTADIEVTIRPVPGEPFYRTFEICFAMDDAHYSSVQFSPYSGKVTIDRKHSGSGESANRQRRCFVPESMDGNIKLRLILDRYSAEVFINDGRYVMSAVIFTDLRAEGISFRTEGQAIADVLKREIRI